MGATGTTATVRPMRSRPAFRPTTAKAASAVWFRRAPAYLFDAPPEPDHVILRIQPDEGVSFAFHVKTPGPGFGSRMRTMDFAYEARPADAYQRLLYDAMTGDRTLFTRSDGVARSWEIVEPVLDDVVPVESYERGTWGPRNAERLAAEIARVGCCDQLAGARRRTGPRTARRTPSRRRCRTRGRGARSSGDSSPPPRRRLRGSARRRRRDPARCRPRSCTQARAGCGTTR